jgi:hypothetical protein
MGQFVVWCGYGCSMRYGCSVVWGKEREGLILGLEDR